MKNVIIIYRKLQTRPLRLLIHAEFDTKIGNHYWDQTYAPLTPQVEMGLGAGSNV